MSRSTLSRFSPRRPLTEPTWTSTVAELLAGAVWTLLQAVPHTAGLDLSLRRSP